VWFTALCFEIAFVVKLLAGGPVFNKEAIVAETNSEVSVRITAFAPTFTLAAAA
jgi:hypothetical protein